MTRQYASETTVSTDASRAEIERTLGRYGADAFVYAQDRGNVTIMFRMSGRMVRFQLALPDRGEKRFTHHSRGRRDSDAAWKVWEQACRQRWRALALVIKAKLEAVSAGITTVEDEFLAHTMLADGRTVGETIRPALDEHVRIGGRAPLLLAPPL